MSIFLFLSLALAALAISLFVANKLCDPSSRWHILDTPTSRSLHTTPKPRNGGIAILAAYFISGSAISILNTELPFFALIALPTLLVALISFIDDCRHLHAGIRFAVHIISCTAVVLGGIYIPDLGVVFCVLFLTWSLNLYNFMDGVDGLAGGMGVIGFGTMGLLGWLAGNVFFAALNITTASAIGGFLLLNLPPSRLFMGDVGACSIGFLAGISMLWGTLENVFPIWVPLLTFSPFLVDTTVTLSLRILKREKFWHGQRNHFYHKLVLRLGHKKTLMIEYPLIIGCAVSAVALLHASPAIQTIGLCIWGGAYFCLLVGITLFARKREILDTFTFTSKV